MCWYVVCVVVCAFSLFVFVEVVMRDVCCGVLWCVVICFYFVCRLCDME